MDRLIPGAVLFHDLIDDKDEMAFDNATDMLYVDHAKNTNGGLYSDIGAKLVDAMETYYLMLDELDKLIADHAPTQVIESVDETAMRQFYVVCELGVQLREQYMPYLPRSSNKHH